MAHKNTKKRSVRAPKPAPTFGWKIFMFLVVALSGLIFKVTYASTWSLVYSEDFNGSSINTGSWTIKTGTEGHHQGVYTSSNVSVHDGMLDLLTQRHCVPSGGSANAGNVSTAVCPGGASTVYTSGKVISKNRWASGRIEIKASLPSTQKGLWPALWLRNPPGWGSSDYGELDIMEWYGDQPKIHTSTSIMGASAVKAHHNLSTASDLSTNGPHTYAAEWSPSGITYYFDGTKLNSSPDVAGSFSGISTSLFSQIMNQTWELRMETEVTKSGDQWHAAPDNNAPFNPAHFLIDSVKVYAAVEPAPEPTPTPPPAPAQASTPPPPSSGGGGSTTATSGGTASGASGGSVAQVSPTTTSSGDITLGTAPTTLSNGTHATKVEYYLNGKKIGEAKPGEPAPIIPESQLKAGNNQLTTVVTDAKGNTESSFKTLYGKRRLARWQQALVVSILIGTIGAAGFWLVWHKHLRFHLPIPRLG